MMGESGILILPICPIRILFPWFIFYESWTNQMNRVNIMNKWINIHLICTNWKNIYSFICNICLICPANWWLIHSICSIRSIHHKSWFNFFNSIFRFAQFALIRSANLSDSHMLICRQSKLPLWSGVTGNRADDSRARGPGYESPRRIKYFYNPRWR